MCLQRLTLHPELNLMQHSMRVALANQRERIDKTIRAGLTRRG
jgi:hypothetical protein